MLPSHDDMDRRLVPQQQDQQQNDDSAISVGESETLQPPPQPPAVTTTVDNNNLKTHAHKSTKRRRGPSTDDSIYLSQIGALDPSLPGDNLPKQNPSRLTPNHESDNMIRTSVRPLAGGPILLHPSAPASLSPSPTLSAMSASLSSIHSADLRGSLSPPYLFSGTLGTRDSSPSSAIHLTATDEDAEERERRERQEESRAAVEQAGEGGSIVVDGDELSDAGYESDRHTSASTSLADSMRDYIYENGRRYHRFREGRYNFPNDDSEQQREDMKHAMVKMLCGDKLYFAPIGSRPQEILDIGTGTGIWAIEMGDLFESATVLGVDLSPIQPEWVPPNVRFMVDDVESPWLHPRNHFDYIHSRHTVMAIKDWPRLMRRSLEHLKPGGWFELHEVYHNPIAEVKTLASDHPVAQYWSLIDQGLANLGVQLHAVANEGMKTMMQECGYINVQEKVLRIPIGPWPKNKVLKMVGVLWQTILLDGIQAIALGPLTRGCGWSREQVELFLIQVRRAYMGNECLYMPLHIIYGQKPLTSF